MESTEMNPNGSPQTFNPPVRRVNKVPFVLFGALALVLVIAMVSAGFARQQSSKDIMNGVAKKDESPITSSIQKAQMLAAAVIPPARETSTPPALAFAPEAGNEPAYDDSVVLREPVNTSPLGAPRSQNPDAERIRQMKMQLFDQAVSSKSSVPVKVQRGFGDMSGGMPSMSGDMSASAEVEQINQQIAALKKAAQENGLLGGGGGSNTSMNIAAPENAGNGGYGRFSGGGGRWDSPSRVETPKSPFELRAGFVIPAVLVSGINSDLPGQIIGQVSQHVFDSASGRYLLIPQGTRLVGTYSSQVSFGQARVMVAWQRLVFPDGKSLDLGAMPGADAAGYAGFHQRVNNHYVRIFGSALLLSGITAGVSLSQDNAHTNDETQRASDALSEALGQQLGETMSDLIRKNINISPTLEIDPGFRFNVMVTRDLIFPAPYRNFDYPLPFDE